MTQNKTKMLTAVIIIPIIIAVANCVLTELKP